MKLLVSDPNTIELKYTESDYPLINEYIGPNRTHGNCYYRPNYIWIECFSDVKGDSMRPEMTYESGGPMGIVCLTENHFISFSLHLSVFEVITKRNGYGTLIMEELLSLGKDLGYKYFTLQPHDNEVIEFYKKFGFIEEYLKETLYLGKVL